MRSASVGAGNEPAELFFCRVRVRYIYVRSGTKNAEAMMASCDVLESPEAML
jgi:hypothetical protein